MPALVVDTAVASSSASSASGHSHSHRRSDSPTSDRPPVSPITPTATVAELAPLPLAPPPPQSQSQSQSQSQPQPRPQPQPQSQSHPHPHPHPHPQPTTRPRPAPPPATAFRQQPPSLPISESENPDAIALRSAISLLQLQRDKSRRDLQALEELKHAAVADPHAFVRSLQEQRAQAARAHNDVLTPTLAGLADASDDDNDDTPASPGQRTDVRKDSAHVDSKAAWTKFPAIPQPQNIVRCPPVEWAKYHIVGEPLDKMHEEQRKWPGSSEPPRIANGMRAPPHSVTAPYSPFKDGVGKSKSPSISASKPTKKSPS